MEFKHFYGSRRNSVIKLLELFIIILTNIFILGFIFFGDITYSIVAALPVSVFITFTSFKSANLRFIKTKILTIMFLATLLVAFFSITSPRW